MCVDEQQYHVVQMPTGKRGRIVVWDDGQAGLHDTAADGCEKVRIALKSKPVFHNLSCSEDAFACLKTYTDPQGSRPDLFTEPARYSYFPPFAE